MLVAVEVMARWLKGELGDDAASAAMLAGAQEALARADTVKPRSRPPQSLEPTEQRAEQTEVAAVPAASPAPGPGPMERWVSVSASQIDELCELVSEFETEFGALQFKLREQARGASTDPSTRGLRSLMTDFDCSRAHLDDITSSAWALRLAPIEPLLAELLTHARALANTQMKRLRVTVGGGHVQLERSILDDRSLRTSIYPISRNSRYRRADPLGLLLRIPARFAFFEKARDALARLGRLQHPCRAGLELTQQSLGDRRRRNPRRRCFQGRDRAGRAEQ